MVHHLILIRGPVRLCDQPGGRQHERSDKSSTWKKTESRCPRHAAQRCGAWQKSGENGVHHGEQRLGEIGKNAADIVSRKTRRYQ